MTGKIDNIDYVLGSALCCFEKSPLPIHQGTRTLVVRVKKITSPIKELIPGYDDWIPKPQEGQLVMRRTIGGRLKPWCLDIDKRAMAADLQGLFRDGG